MIIRKILAFTTAASLMMSAAVFAAPAAEEITFQDETGSIVVSPDNSFIVTTQGQNMEGAAFDLYVIGSADENGTITLTSLTDGQVELIEMASEEQLANDTATAQALYQKAIDSVSADDTAETADADAAYDIDEVYRMAQKALDNQAIQNVMSRHVMYHCYGLHQEELEQIWVQEPENQATASFGQNQGYMVGYPAIWEAYVDGHTESWLESAKKYCANNDIDIEGWSDEEILNTYGGVGQLLLHVTTTAIIEVAEDGQTAKCFWYSPGLVAETGQSGNAIWEAYGVDFVKENGEWKIWHLHMYTDFTGSFFVDLSKSGNSGGGQSKGEAAPDAPAAPEDSESAPGESPEGESPEGESPADPAAAPEQTEQAAQPEGNQGWQPEGGEVIAMDTVNEYLSDPTYTIFSSDRLLDEMMIYIPTPYETWSFDDPNYGLSTDQYALYNIDLDAWYAAHAG